MIVENKVSDVMIVGGGNIKKATINENKMAKLQYLLTKGLYKDPITAVVAEWTNNAIDSVVSSGKDPIENPVIVTLGQNDQRQYFLTVKDTGLGLDADDFENICMNYLTSTKEEDNDTLGAYGIGMKSFLALERSAIFTCIKNGVERKYIAFEGEEFVSYDLMHEKETDEENGVTCELIIKNYSEYQEFHRKAKQKLAYYDRAVLVIGDAIVTNTIIRGEHWQYSDNNSDNLIHLCLKDVYYAIDYAALGIHSINLKIALRFNLEDGLIPTPSRESYITNEKTKQLILDKLEQVAKDLLELYNSRVTSAKTFLEAYPHINSNPKIELCGLKYDLHPLFSKFGLTPKEIAIEGVKHFAPSTLKRMFEHLCMRIHTIGEADFGATRRKHMTQFNYHVDRAYSWGNKILPMVRVEECFYKGYAKRYIWNDVMSKHSSFLVFNISNDKRDLQYYKQQLNLKRFNRGKWRAMIQEFLMVEQSIIDSIPYEDLSLNNPKLIAFIESERKKLKDARIVKPSTYQGLNKQDGDITLNIARPSQKERGKLVFEKKASSIGHVEKASYLTVLMEGNEFEEALVMCHRSNSLRFVKVGVREINKVPTNSKKFITFSKFMATKTFSRIVTAILFQKALKKCADIKYSVYTQVVNAKYEKSLSKIKEYVAEHIDESSLSPVVKEGLLKLAEEKGLFDKQFWPEYLNVKEYGDTYGFLTLIKTPHSWDDQEKKDVKRLVNQILLFKKKYYDGKDYEMVAIEEPKPILEEEKENDLLETYI